MCRMKRILIMCAALSTLTGLPALADEVNTAELDFDKRHEVCLERIADDPELAYEEASIWQSHGGGRRARHCVAMTLFALGHPDEAAFRLEKLAKAPDGGSPEMRAGYYVEATDLWLEAELPKKAYKAASAGLKIVEASVDLRIARARAYAAMGRWDYAEKDLTNALAYSPDEPRALRYRADARKRQEKLVLAKADIERAVALDDKNIEALVVRGQIIEAIRLKELEKPDN
jgi:tetratricopeptide (TPR) repeat protein